MEPFEVSPDAERHGEISILQGLVAHEWRRLLRPQTPLPVRAAQYVRMSTEHQQYSPENQLEVVRQYAASHNMEIVQEYSDHGRSGLNIAGREGLNKLMSDVESKRTDFSALLVYGGTFGWRLFRGTLNRQTRVCDSREHSVPGQCGPVFHHRRRRAVARNDWFPARGCRRELHRRHTA